MGAAAATGAAALTAAMARAAMVIQAMSCGDSCSSNGRCGGDGRCGTNGGDDTGGGLLNSSKYGTIAVYIAAMASVTVCFIGDFMSLRSPMWFMYGHLLGTCPALHVCTFTLFIDYQAPLSAHRVPW